MNAQGVTYTEDEFLHANLRSTSPRQEDMLVMYRSFMGDREALKRRKIQEKDAEIRKHRTPPTERDISGSLMEVLARYEHELTQEEKNAVGRALEVGKREAEIKELLSTEM